MKSKWLVLCVVLTLLLSGCSIVRGILEKQPSPSSSSSSPHPAQWSPTPWVAPIVAPSPEGTPPPSSSEPTVQPSPDPVPSPSPQAESLSMAKWEGDVFISDWAGFRLPLPVGWYKATDDEIRELNQLGAEMLAGATGESAEFLQNIDAIYPLFIMKHPPGVQTTEINTNITMVFEKTSALSDQRVTDPGEYLDFLKNQFEGMDIGYAFEPKGSRVVAGQTYVSLIAILSDYGMRQMFLCRKHDGYFISIIMTGSINNQAELDNLADSFTEN
ncbi:MAG: hypothetical protein R6W96_04570 [Clostridia bacterium]